MRIQRHHNAPRTIITFAVVFGLTVIFTSLTRLGIPRADAQTRRVIPGGLYYDAWHALGDGNPSAAEQLSAEALRSAVRVGSVRWLDSICYYAVHGEALYTLGDFDGALSDWDAAIDLYLQNRDWLGRVNYIFEATSRARTAAPWGAGERPVPVGVFPPEATIVTGDVITDQRLKQGGLMAQQEMHRIDPIAVLRAMALSIRRRNELLGPLAPYDPRSPEIVSCFSTRSVTPNHWSVTWLDVLLGLAYQGIGKWNEAENILTKALLMTGQFDHVLSSCALLALGDGYIAEGKTKEAATCFFEASISSFQFDCYAETAEAFEKYANVVRVEEAIASPEILQTAWDWAGSVRGAVPVRLALALALAENALIAAESGDGTLGLAERYLGAARSILLSAHMDQSPQTDQWNRLNAICNFMAGDSKSGAEALQLALDGAAERTPRLYQIALLEDQLQSGDWELSPRNICELYEILLRDSDPIDWMIAPLETLAFDCQIGSEVFENWFLLLMNQRNLPEQAFEIAERARQARFDAGLDFGGRALAIRLLLETPDSKLPEEPRSRQQVLLEHYSAYNEALSAAKELTGQLKRADFPPADAPTRAAYEQLWESADVREEIIKRMIPSRLYVPKMYPPRYAMADIQALLPEEGTLLVFFRAIDELYGFLVTPNFVEGWRVGLVKDTGDAVAAFLKSIGVTDANGARQMKDVASTAWQSGGRDLLRWILGIESGGERFNVQFRQLAIVPDDLLWYLPFEALCLPQGDNLIALAQVPGLTLFYAPTAGLAFTQGTGETAATPDTGIVPGSLFAKKKNNTNSAAAADRIAKGARKAISIVPSGINRPSSMTAFRFDRLAVLREILGGDDWDLYDTGKSRDSFHSWEQLPFGSPKLIALPGYRTLGEDGMKNGGDGSELFIPLMTLMARGCDTVLISRWRTGGRSAYDLTENFLSEENQRIPAPEAWKNVLSKFFEKPLVLDEEPRFKGTAKGSNGKDSLYPFFWGGYLLASRSLVPPEPIPVEETPEGVEDDESVGDDESVEEGGADGAEETESGVSDDALDGDVDETSDENPEDAEGADAEGEDSGAKSDTGNDDASEGNGDAAEGNADGTESGTGNAGKDAAKTGGEKSARKSGAKSRDRRTSGAKTGAKADSDKPRSPSPVTDEDLERADEAADDFYAPNK